VRIAVALESVRPGFAVHADARLFAARIAEAVVDRQGATVWLKVQHEQAMISIFAGVQNDAPIVRVGGDPVRLCFSSKVNARYFADVRRIGNIPGCDRVHRGLGLNPVMPDSQRHVTLFSIKSLQVPDRRLVRVDALQLVQRIRRDCCRAEMMCQPPRDGWP